MLALVVYTETISPKSGCGGGKEEDKKETDFEFDFCGPEVRTY